MFNLDYDDIKSVSWEVECRIVDDRDDLYEGHLELTLVDGTVLYTYLDWVRGGTEEELSSGDLSRQVAELKEYESVYGEFNLERVDK